MSGLAVGTGQHLHKGIAVGLLVFFAAILFTTLRSDTGLILVENFLFKKAIYIDNSTFYVWVARTDKEREEALNNKEGMPANGGMIFAFDTDGLYAVSTAKVQFPIDIIWLNQEGTVVSTEVYIPPGRAYPARPTAPARYVLLLNGGVADKNYIGNESHVNISNIQ